MGNKHPVMTVFGISLWMKVGHEGDHMQCFKCGRKWNSSPKPLSVCSTGATHTQGPLHVCVKCLTPTKTPPNQSCIFLMQRVLCREKVVFLSQGRCFLFSWPTHKAKTRRCLMYVDYLRKHYQPRSFPTSTAFFRGSL